MVTTYNNKHGKLRPHIAGFHESIKALESSELQLLKGYFPTELAKLYNFPGDATGRGESIAILEFGGGYSINTLRKYFNDDLQIKVPDIKDISVNGGSNNPPKCMNNIENLKFDDCSKECLNSSYLLEKYWYSSEVYMDIEIIGSIARDAQLNVYFGGQTSKVCLVDALRKAVDDDNSVISLSWGSPEIDWYQDKLSNKIPGKGLSNDFCKDFKESAERDLLKEIDSILEDARRKGITICTSTGDQGSSDGVNDGNPHVDFPSSHPLILACGGTRIETNNMSIESEVVWNDMLLGTTGGGFSDIYPMPSYQTDVHPPLGFSKGRGLPDVVADASIRSGYKVRFDTPFGDHLLVLGGTSASTPLWAALVALLNEKLNTRLGFINPYLYQIAQREDIFNHIASGNNGCYHAVKEGWSACTGWGSPKSDNLLNALSKLIINN